MGEDPFEGALWGGFSGASFEAESFDLDDGLCLSKTYAHLMAPYLMAFAPPPRPGTPHPPPWAAVQGGAGFDIIAQLCVRQDFSPPGSFDRLNTIWWVAALLRLRATPLVRVPVISNRPFTTPQERTESGRIWPVEANRGQLRATAEPKRVISEQDLNWVKRHLRTGAKLMYDHDNFNVAFQAFAQCIWTSSGSLALVQLWGALQQLFATSRYHVTTKLSRRLAAFLSSTDGALSETDVRMLYDVRSVAAHGQRAKDPEALYQTYGLLRSVLIKMIEEEHVPDGAELEAMA